MSVPNPQIRFTYDDYQTLPEDSLKHYELLDGNIVVSPSPTFLHQLVSANLEFLLQTHVRSHQLGLVIDAPMDVVFGQADAREVAQPDIIFISNKRRAIITNKEIQGAPDLLIEILSNSTAQRDRGYKKNLYARYGVLEYWIVDPEAQSIAIYAMKGDDVALTNTYQGAQVMHSVLFPGLDIDLGEVFPEH